MRGEFHCANGLVIPNNITRFGARTLLAAAVRNEVPTFYVGLVDGAPDPDLLISSLSEPLFANGYTRQAILRSNVGWPVEGVVNGETYFESDWLTWASTDKFDKPVRRLMLVSNQTNVADDATPKNLRVLALSATMPADLLITKDTPEANRKFKYRLYAR